MTIRQDFTWDETKATANRRKHGVSFSTAQAVFRDPYALTEFDRVEAGEVRWRTIGLVNGVVVLLLIHTILFEGPGWEVVRIISARRAEPHERSRYERHRLGKLDD